MVVLFIVLDARGFVHLTDKNVSINEVFSTPSAEFMLTLAGIYLFSVLGIIFVATNIISDYILYPVSELKKATDKMSNNDLDVNINYNKRNEFGELCDSFNEMKNNISLKAERQKMYEESKKQLVVSITHDLRTPLTSIIGYVEGLQDKVVTDPETVDNYLDVIHSKALRLNQLINDLFEFSQFELSKFPIKKEKIQIKTVLTEYINTKKKEFNNINIEFIVSNIDEAVLFIDEFRIGQVLENLIDNAKKFTNSYIKLYTEDEPNFYNIYIQDDGIGISEENLPFIFDYFFKCDRSRSVDIKGTGIGLAICKQIVLAHGGEIFVRSKIGTGTEFRIKLNKLNK